MHYTIYQVTNKITGKIYIGSHKTANLEDGYMGSGKYLNYAISKHGIEKFTKEILFVFDNPTDMYNKEAELVNEDYISNANTYNLKVGGFGGWDYVNSKNLNNANKDKAEISLKISQRLKGRKASPSRVQALINRHKRGELKHTYFGNRKNDKQLRKLAHSPTANAKRKKTYNKIKFQQGINNSQYGTCWICHELFGDIKIKKDALSLYIDQGWMLGKLEKYNNRIIHAKNKQKRKDEIKNKRKTLATLYRDRFVKLNYKSIRKFIRDGHYDKSHQSLINLWKRYIPEFDPGYR